MPSKSFVLRRHFHAHSVDFALIVGNSRSLSLFQQHAKSIFRSGKTWDCVSSKVFVLYMSKERPRITTEMRPAFPASHFEGGVRWLWGKSNPRSDASAGWAGSFQGQFEPFGEKSLCLHTCRRVSSSLSFFLSLPPCSQFCFVPKILILSFRKGAEVNKSTIKAFFLSRIDPLFFGWTDFRRWFLSLTQLLLPWRDGKMEKGGNKQYC